MSNSLLPCRPQRNTLGSSVLHYLPEFSQELKSLEMVMLSNHLILCCPLLLLLSIFPSIRVFTNESALHIRRPKYWSFSINPPNEYLQLIYFRIDWFDLFAVQGTLKSLSLLHGPTLTSIYDYWKNHSLTIWTIVSKVIFLLLNMLSGFVIAPFQGASIFSFHGWSPCLQLIWSPRK